MKLLLNTFILIFVLSPAAFAQEQTAREAAIALFKQKNYMAAAQALQTLTKTNKKDAEIWNMLGLAYLSLSDFKQSRQALGNAVKISPQDSTFRTNLAFANLLGNKLKPAAKEAETAIRLNPRNAEAYYLRGNINLRQNKFENAIADADRAIGINPAFASSYLLKANGYLYSFGEALAKGAKPSDRADLLKKASEVLEVCLKDCEKNSDFSLHREALGAAKAFYSYFSANRDETLAPETQTPTVDAGVKPMKILAKPRASYTDSARSAGIQGVVKIAVLFSAEGRTKYVMVVKPLSNGLTEEAIKAARQITFEPQLKDGKPVSVVKTVEYTFTLY
ncbi:MAG TPA: TonB family protein [Pyrinomonadaceae bacterium]